MLAGNRRSPSASRNHSHLHSLVSSPTPAKVSPSLRWSGTPGFRASRFIQLTPHRAPHLTPACQSVRPVESEPVGLTQQVCRAPAVRWTDVLRTFQRKGMSWLQGEPVMVLEGLGGWGESKGGAVAFKSRALWTTLKCFRYIKLK